MDYSFMKTGFTPLKENNSSQESVNTIYEIIKIFTSNALDHSSEYVRICNRNTITQEDMRMGLINELFDFIERNSKELQHIENINKIYKRETDLYYLQITDEVDSDEDSDEDYHETTETNDSNNEPENLFKRADKNSIKNSDDRFFAEKMHDYVDRFPEWVPQNNIEQILKSAIDKTITDK